MIKVGTQWNALMDQLMGYEEATKSTGSTLIWVPKRHKTLNFDEAHDITL